MGVEFLGDPLQYPFEVPLHSYLWTAGRIQSLSPSTPVPALTAGRQAILAIGSNASPAQLTRKFRDKRFVDPSSPHGCIPVLRAEVDEVDVVYGAHLAGYGALPATLLRTRGACAHVFVTWLTTMQLERMNETEDVGHAYLLRRMTGVRSHGEEVDSVMSYVTMAGVALLGGRPLGLASIHTVGSSGPRGTQRQAWDHLSVDMGCGGDGKALLDQVLCTPAWRERVASHLVSTGLPEDTIAHTDPVALGLRATE
jgi:hypothetical protein